MRNDLQMTGMITWWIGFWHWMTEWLSNEMIFEIRGFAFVQKYPFISSHSVIWASFLNEKTALNVQNDTGMRSLQYNISFLVISGGIEWHRNDRMRRNEVVFGREEKNWILRCPSFHHHSISSKSFETGTSCSILNDTWVTVKWPSNIFNQVLSPLRRQHPIKIIWRSFKVISMSFQTGSYSHISNDIQMTVKWPSNIFNLVLSPLRRQHRIKIIWRSFNVISM